ncbi:MAG TPA: M23 family metallopeptidase [Chloroflexia bacterium]|nr:M23 family metallopeptidase [Chloroflexia bacterium]
MQREYWRRRWLLGIVILALAGWGPGAPAGAQAAPPPDGAAGPTLRGSFADFWDMHNGALLFGAPVGDEVVTPNLTVQYCERARLEWHPDWPPGRQITLGLLGAEVLAGRTFPPVAPFPSSADHQYFAVTGHSIGGEILRFWRGQGGLPIFGYPLSEELSEDGYTVQYFERARLEWHPELGGTGYGVIPTPLGTLLAPPAEAATAVGVEPPAAQNGHTVLIKVLAPTGTTVTGRFAGQDLAFVCCLPLTPADDRWQQVWAVGGVEPGLTVAPQLLQVRIGDDQGNLIRQIDRLVAVQPYPFPLRRSAYPYTSPRPSTATATGEQDRLRALAAGRSGPPRWTGLWTAPLAGPLTVTAPFGERRAYNAEPVSVIHGGVDLAADLGTPIWAPAPGRVVLAEPLAERGNAIMVDHGAGVFTLYAHLSAFRVQAGQDVQAGDLLGLIGSTGLATGPHLHWEVYVAGALVEPLQWLQRSFP